MSYLKRRDGSIKLVNGVPVSGIPSFVVVQRHQLAENVPAQDINTQDEFNLFVLELFRSVLGYNPGYAATAQTYHATAQDYLDKFGIPSAGTPLSATSYEGYSYNNQQEADALALSAAKTEVVSKLVFNRLPNTSGTPNFSGVNPGLLG